MSAFERQQQMDETSLETMLESFDNLPDLVFNNLDEADPSTSNQKLILVVRLRAKEMHDWNALWMSLANVVCCCVR